MKKVSNMYHTLSMETKQQSLSPVGYRILSRSLQNRRAFTWSMLFILRFDIDKESFEIQTDTSINAVNCYKSQRKSTEYY